MTMRNRHPGFRLAIIVTLAASLAGCSTVGAPTGAERQRDGSSLPSTASGQPSHASSPDGFPIGSWSTTITEADLRSAGFTKAGELAENAGVFTMTLDPDGTWTTTQQASVALRWPVFKGTWTVTGPNSFSQRTTFPPDFVGDQVGFTWRRADDALLLKLPNPPDPVLPVVMETHPWQPAS